MKIKQNKIETIFRTTLAALCALVLGILLATMILQEEPWVKQLLQAQVIASIEDITGKGVACDIQAVNLLTGEIVITNIAINGPDASWKVLCDTLVIKFSLFDLLVKKIFHAQFNLLALQVYSKVIDSKLAIAAPIEKFLATPSVIPFELHSITLRRSTVEIEDQAHAYRVTCLFSSDTFMQDSIIKNKIFLLDGAININGRNIIESLQGTAYADMYDTKDILAQTHCSAVLPDARAASRESNIHFSYNKTGLFALNSVDQALSFTLRDIDFSKGISADFSSHIDAAAFFDQTGSIDITGSTRYGSDGFQLSSEITCNELQVAPRIKNLDIALTSVGNAYHMTLDANDIRTLNATLSPTGNIGGKGKAGEMGETGLQIEIASISDIWLSQEYAIKELLCKAVVADGNVQGDFKGSYSDTAQKRHAMAGEFSHTSLKSMITAQVDVYSSSLIFDQRAQQAQLEVQDDKKNKIIRMNYDAQAQEIDGAITFAPIKKILKHGLGIDIPGEGTILLKGSHKDQLFACTTSLESGTIKIPHIYNTIKSVHGDWIFDLKEKKILINALKIMLHSGQLEINSGSCYFNDTYGLEFALIPMHLHNCLGNWEKAFFGLFSGYVFFKYDQNKATLAGNLVIDKATVKHALVSSDDPDTQIIDAMKSVTPKQNNVLFDIQVATRDAIKINTSFFQTKARGAIQVGGSFEQPEVGGTIALHEGVLIFPYKPLYISDAKIYLNPLNPKDAFIDLVAKNTIKKFAIQMQVTGSVQSPHITFSSSPMLQDEQILTMLLAGSQDGSLFGVMPQMVMQGLEKMLFSTQSSSDWLQSLKNVLKPLGNVRIKPALLDKQNKPVKGGFEIDVNDRLSALIANNLDLSDETSVELEYALTDDTTLRGARDDKGSISGEIEVRWKF